MTPESVPTRVEVRCPVCGHFALETESSGKHRLRCSGCRVILRIVTEDGQIASIEIEKKKP